MRIIKDTREHENKGWDFDNMVIQGLKTGDYSIEGYEDIFTIERKGSISEFAGNIWQKRLEKEFERLEKFIYPFIILEFDMKDILLFPENSGIPKSKWSDLKVTPGVILEKISYFQCKYKTKIILAGRLGKTIAINLFRQVLECHPLI